MPLLFYKTTKKTFKTMEQQETPHHHRGATVNIYGTINNYFDHVQGNVINNFGTNEKPKEKHAYNDNQLAQALKAICGPGKPLNQYQQWLGVCCWLAWQCDYPRNLDDCCRRINMLPMETLPIECKYDNIRKFGYLPFVREGAQAWADYKPREEEKRLFYDCKMVAQALEAELHNNQYQQEKAS